MKVRIYYHHTDSGGVVYYANYLKFLEEARTEYLEERGISVKELSEKGILFVVARQEIDYKYPAFYGDTLSVKTLLTEISGVKLVFECE
ncbi:MAG: YbgC/FadM family acyl-CoA thioesterase, partial [Candidatus Omnitrophota bacterium]